MQTNFVPFEPIYIETFSKIHTFSPGELYKL